uniref:Mitochondrial carrier protein n=1 Tax=Picocystis salinarum TaxID=88271 RepID=A0A7S3UGU9_9CHLO|mmetsp:Transcript_5930/g.36771  ORF Transcript_5930/g.36771 Transcript_5930/m.36771 type:complete len:314 (-) Transcript_5930:345-1286(-)|eukprot:CAMPEP_0183826798 /NCGR_PEP_ID=MMETSP0807_2-20130328/1886_1 /TAXON_ID=88271 /ORGANISM="Picocystis salinarum, Strain CCMP1897" /LENGTH=313 /DNA_ID=CAMNT_0026071927 /DNA_START=87 /DNA_END=1028 /DNA_ORIENTATION=+
MAAASDVPKVGRSGPDHPPRGLWAYLDGSRMFFAGGAAGATARTCTAPLDRIKLLFQVQAVQSAGVGSTAYTGVWQSIVKIWKEEGIKAYWKGNGTNIIRIFPYSAAQLMSNDQYKRILADDSGNLSVVKRLTAGACAGMTATTLTHPLDTVRLRLALPNTPYHGMVNAVVTISSKEGLFALYKGLAPTLVGIAPYAALNFSTYDLLKTWTYSNGGVKQSPVTNIGIGAMAGTLASTVCYPLDTVRRRMQMPGQTYSGQADALVQIFRKEGVRGFFRGWAANTLKVVPQNSIRFVTYEFLKSLLGVKKAKTDT